MRVQIDFERKLSFDEHMLLYYYDRLQNGNRTNYDDWVLRESLINSFNLDNREESQDRLDALIMECDGEIAELQEEYNDRPWDIEKPVIWGDRVRDEYYIRNLEDSHRFEVYAESIFLKYGLDIGLYYGRAEQYDMGETRAGIEIKCDKRSVETGNYYFEYQERLNTRLDWTDSGILKDDNTRYYFYGVVGDYNIFSRDAIWEYYRRLVLNGERIDGCRNIGSIPRGTSRGFIVSKDAIRNISIDPADVAREILEN